MSVTIVTGNATFPSSNLSDVSPLDPVHIQIGVAPTTLPYEHVKAALIAIVAGIISFTTIVGNIMAIIKGPAVGRAFIHFVLHTGPYTLERDTKVCRLNFLHTGPYILIRTRNYAV